MFKYILVPATGADTEAPVFSTALAVARLSSSHLEFLHVGIEVQQTLTAIVTGDMGMGAGVGYGQILKSLEQDVAARRKKAEQAFHDLCERERLTITSDLSTDLPRRNGGWKSVTSRHGSPNMDGRLTCWWLDAPARERQWPWTYSRHASWQPAVRC